MLDLPLPTTTDQRTPLSSCEIHGLQEFLLPIHTLELSIGDNSFLPIGFCIIFHELQLVNGFLVKSVHLHLELVSLARVCFH